MCREALNGLPDGAQGRGVLLDLLERLRAYRCFIRTMRNMMAWTESVHGSMQAREPAKKDAYRKLCKATVSNELDNARELLDLWNTRTTSFMPVSSLGETLHIYGDNFGDLVAKKIALMERHKDDEPFIDPDFMWRTAGAPGAGGALPEGDGG